MKGALSKDKEKIAQMFDHIASNYDFLNHLLSFNIDKCWRKKLIRSVSTDIASKRGNIKFLDLACGTGDVARGLSSIGIKVTGMDISTQMLAIAKEKSKSNGEYTDIEYIVGSADEIPFTDNHFDGVTISFGIRNFDHRDICIDEIYRVIKPGGTLHILEFSIPKNKIWRSIYCFYFSKILPIIGRIISSEDFAYKYLPLSAMEFPCRETFCNEISSHGFCDVNYKSLTGGVACLYRGVKQLNTN